jgi:CrcB protein
MRQRRGHEPQPLIRDEAIAVDSAERYHPARHHLTRVGGRAEVLLGAGAIMGVFARHLLGGLVTQAVPTLFPLGTLIVNLLGCLVIGVAQTLFLDFGAIRREAQIFLVVGLCGGFTTFSTFSVETIRLFQAGQPALALGYQVLSLAGGIAAVALGMIATRGAYSLLAARQSRR